MLKTNRTLGELDLSQTKLGPGAGAIAEALEENSTLVTLRLDEAGVDAFCSHLLFTPSVHTFCAHLLSRLLQASTTRRETSSSTRSA